MRAAVSGEFTSDLLHILMPLSSEDQADTFTAPLVAAMNANQISTPASSGPFSRAAWP